MEDTTMEKKGSFLKTRERKKKQTECKREKVFSWDEK